MKQLDKYKLNKKIMSLSNFVWEGFVWLSKLIVLFYFIMTSFMFWSFLTVVFSKYGNTNISQGVIKMFLVVVVLLIIIFIDFIIKKNKRINKFC